MNPPNKKASDEMSDKKTQIKCLISYCLQHFDTDRHPKWSLDFVKSLEGFFEERGYLTTRQLDTLETIKMHIEEGDLMFEHPGGDDWWKRNE